MTAEAHRKCGTKQPRIDNFADVKRALHAWLMEHNAAYREASRRGVIRHQAVQSEESNEDN